MFNSSSFTRRTWEVLLEVLVPDTFVDCLYRYYLVQMTREDPRNASNRGN